jgi:hypothetical protein
MKYTDIAKAALVLVLGVMTSTAFAADYGEAFETISTTTNILSASVTPPWSGGADDVSKVVAGVPGEPAIGYPLPEAAHTKVLQLNTEGGNLTNTLASAASFQTANVWVDTMVKFVPSEDLPTFSGPSDIKVAAYAYVKEVQASPLITTTNLAVYHGYYDGSKSPSFWKTNTVTALPVNVDQWYRLTIQLANGTTGMQAFRILVNGTPITNAIAYKDDWDARVDPVSEDFLPNNGPWFLSAASVAGGSAEYQVATLQFKGTGFIDDLVVTAEDPLAIEEPAGFIVTQNLGANGTCTDTNLTITVTGVSTTLTYTAADFYQIATLTTNGTAVSGAAGSKSKTINIFGATSVTSTFAIVTGYGDVDNVAWFNSKGWTQAQVVSGLDYDTLEMMNCAPTNAAAGGTITIEGIEVVGDDVKVTVFINRTMSIGANIVGTLKLYGAATLEGSFTAIGEGITIGTDQDGSQDDIRKEITYIMAGGKKFYKAVIE